MNDVYAIRIRRLLKLIDERCGGVKAQLASDMNWKPSDVSRFFGTGKHSRRITETKARAIEKRYRTGDYWMDRDEDTPLTAAVYSNLDQKTQDRLLTLFDGLTDTQQQEVIARIQVYNATNKTVLKQLGGKASAISRKRGRRKVDSAPAE